MERGADNGPDATARSTCGSLHASGRDRTCEIETWDGIFGPTSEMCTQIEVSSTVLST